MGSRGGAPRGMSELSSGSKGEGGALLGEVTGLVVQQSAVREVAKSGMHQSGRYRKCGMWGNRGDSIAGWTKGI